MSALRAVRLLSTQISSNLNAKDGLEYLATPEDSEKANMVAAVDVCLRRL